MEIQRQSDYYNLDRPVVSPPRLTASEITDFTKGVGIPQGLLNTRTAWREGEEWTYAPEMHTPQDDDEWPEEYHELDDELEALERFIPEDLVAKDDIPLELLREVLADVHSDIQTTGEEMLRG